VPYYGYDGNGPLVPSVAAPTVEAQKTEPDKNTYLVLPGLKGADGHYDYGTQFLFQGHEAGTPGYITRINLDADGAHRVTLLATKDSDGNAIKDIDGSTWDPWAQKLLFTVEAGTNGGVYQATPDYPSTSTTSPAGSAAVGLEGIQNDSAGELWLVEDVGGSNGTGANASARRPNSFLYRFAPHDTADLRQGGTIQALQVLVHGKPLTFNVGGGTADEAITSPDYAAIHAYGSSFPTKWITIAETTSSSPAPGPDLNTLAKTAGATPFKRPENGQFRPGSHFTEFYLDETGDTNANTSASASGGFGAVFKRAQRDPAANGGTLSILYNSDVVHSAFDNVAFFSQNKVAFVEDAGETLHTQRNALDSAYLLDVTADYSNRSNQPVRFLAEGRDPSATIDSGLSGSPGFTNDGDNEITGIHVSDGDPTRAGILGAKVPAPFASGGGWRVFFSQQHGDNPTYELVPAR
jgi:hypothetical protein